VFTLVNAVLFRGLPFDEPESIMTVWAENEQNERRNLTHPNYIDLREQSQSLGSLSAVLNSTVNLADDGQPAERIQGAYVSANFFRMLGEQPVLGRNFVDEDDREGVEAAVLLGYSGWQDRYGGDPGVLGLSIRVNSLVGTVIGVMGPDMRFPKNTDLWIPLRMLPPESRVDERDGQGFQVIGRLASGASIERAREELGAIGRRLADAYPESNRELGFNLASFQEQQNEGEIRLIFLMLLGAVVFVLLVACANVANLLLARSADRTREIAVRVSMGATRGRIVRQLLIESLLLAVLAGAVGLALSVYGVRWFDGVTSAPEIGKPYYMEFTMDPVVFVFMAGVCIATAFLFGLAPALQVSKTDVSEVLKEGSRGSSGGAACPALDGLPDRGRDRADARAVVRGRFHDGQLSDARLDGYRHGDLAIVDHADVSPLDPVSGPGAPQGAVRGTRGPPQQCHRDPSERADHGSTAQRGGISEGGGGR